MDILLKDISEEELKEYFKLFPNLKIYTLYDDMSKKEKQIFRQNYIKKYGKELGNTI